MGTEQAIVHENSEPRRPQRVVVFGGSGLLGGHLVLRLSKAAVETVAPSSRELDLSGPKAAARLADILRPTDAVVFLAATKLGARLDEGSFVENVAMGAALCKAIIAVGCAHVLYMSSDSVYPFERATINEHTPSVPSTLYALMHRARETMLGNLGSLPLAILRVTQVYGPGDPHRAYGPGRMVRSALNEGRIVLYGTGEETRDHISVSDVSSVMFDMLFRRSRGLLNVATGRSVSFAELANLVARSCGFTVRIEHEPARMPVLHRTFDITALQGAFPDRSQTKLEAGIDDMIAAERQLTEIGSLGDRLSEEPLEEREEDRSRLGRLGSNTASPMAPGFNFKPGGG